MILEEFDQSREAIINPEDLNESIEGFPETAVSCFARETFARLLADFDHELITTTSWSFGLCGYSGRLDCFWYEEAGAFRYLRHFG